MATRKQLWAALAASFVSGSAARGRPPAPSRQATSIPNAAGVYDVKALGARGDGVTLDTPAINKAIEAAAAARARPSAVLPVNIYTTPSISRAASPFPTAYLTAAEAWLMPDWNEWT